MWEIQKRELANRPGCTLRGARPAALGATPAQAGKGITMRHQHRQKDRTESGSLTLLDLTGSLRVLADPTRLQILESLLGGVQCNCNIREILGLPMNLISHHLKILKEAGLVRAERDPSDARWIYYQIESEALVVLRNALYDALDPARLRPRGDTCGPPGCCPPDDPTEKPRATTSRRSTP